MQTNSRRHNHSSLNWKEDEKLQKFKNIKNEENFFDEIKSFLHNFWMAFLCKE